MDGFVRFDPRGPDFSKCVPQELDQVDDIINDPQSSAEQLSSLLLELTKTGEYWVSQKKLVHKSEGKTAPKKENNLAES